MMKKKLQITNASLTLSGIFVFLLLISLFFNTERRGSSEGIPSVFIPFSSDEITSVSINNVQGRDKEIILSKQGESVNEWTVKTTNGDPPYKADGDQIRNMLNIFNGIEVLSVVTKNENNHRRYGVDSTGIMLSMYTKSNNKPSFNFVVGTLNQARRGVFQSYVRQENEKVVYAVEGALRFAFDKDENEWRDKVVWDILVDDIVQVDLNFTPSDSSFTMIRADDKWLVNDNELDKSKVTKLLNKVAKVMVRNFQKQNPATLTNLTNHITVHTSIGTQRNLFLGDFAQNNNEFIAKADGYPYVFTLNATEWREQVLKGVTFFEK